MNRRALVLVLGQLPLAGCSSETPADPDGAAPDIANQADTTTTGDANEAGPEAFTEDASVRDDASISIDSGVHDVGCACSTFDSGIPQVPRAGLVAMSCYCDMPWAGFGSSAKPCMTYDEALVCKNGSGGAMITYTNCDFVTFNYGSNGVDQRHYDAKTHLFVGARRGVDHTVPCGAEQVLTIQAGVLPSAECQTAKIEYPCFDAGAGDAGEDGILDARLDAPASDAGTDVQGARSEVPGGWSCPPSEVLLAAPRRPHDRGARVGHWSVSSRCSFTRFMQDLHSIHERGPGHSLAPYRLLARTRAGARVPVLETGEICP